MEVITTTPDQVPQTHNSAPAIEAERSRRGDKHIWGIYLSLFLISIIELYSASSREVAASSIGVLGPIVRHAIMLVAGFFIILWLQRLHYRVFLKGIPILLLVSIAMMVYVMVAGDVINGARRSFHILGITLQPSEFIKLTAAAVIALIMSRAQIKGGGVTRGAVILTAGIVMLFGVMLLPQGLTNTVLLMGISLSMMLIGGVRMKHFMVVLLVYCLCFGVFYAYKHRNRDPKAANTELVDEQISTGQHIDRTNTQKARILRWLGSGTPKYEEKITAENRQEMYGFMAQANGGVIGVFPGNSRETSRLPLAFSDFIYSIIVEDIGFVGGVVVLLLYLWLLARAAVIASRCSRAFPALLVIGMAVMIVFQALSHIAIVTGVMPVSGQPLPLISKGGTSILVTSIAIGVMLSVSRYAVRSGKKKEIKQEIDALPEDVRAENPTQLS